MTTEQRVTAQPLVSIGIPLYRSRRFLDTIIENLDAITYAPVEIVVSDRHLIDDAIDALEARYGADPRFRFLRATDALSWVDHFNLLMKRATGAYIVLMAHDDSYPSHYVGALVAALEAHPDAVLAFGRVEQVSLDGYLPTLPFSPPPTTAAVPWSLGSALRMLTLWQLWFAFRGMVRRRAIDDAGLYIRPTYRNIRADIYWVFALGLRGRLLFVPSCWCTKRFHRASGGADWRFDLRQSLDACRVLRGYLNDYAASPWDAMRGQMAVYPWCLVQALLPKGMAKRLMRWRERVRTHAPPPPRA